MWPRCSMSVCRTRWISERPVSRLPAASTGRAVGSTEPSGCGKNPAAGKVVSLPSSRGSLDEDLRRRCTTELAGRDFDGFAIGGLAVGEPPDALHEAVAMAAPMLPDQRPRYLMGVGYPEDLVHAMACGVDLFDCVLPTRSARTGKVFTSSGEINIKNARFADDLRPLDEACDCPTCAGYTRAALRHLYVAKEVTSVVLLTMHNLTLFSELDARGSGSYHGGPLWEVSAADRQYPQSTATKPGVHSDCEVSQWKVQPGEVPCPCCCRSC